MDGRQITAQELHEMAETYDPEHYTANLWPEHRRWFNMGQVIELKVEDNEKGETQLFAVIAPNQELIEYNRADNIYSPALKSPRISATAARLIYRV